MLKHNLTLINQGARHFCCKVVIPSPKTGQLQYKSHVQNSFRDLNNNWGGGGDSKAASFSTLDKKDLMNTN